MTSSLDAAALAQFVDHTLLKPEATTADVEALIAEGARLGVYSCLLYTSPSPRDS